MALPVPNLGPQLSEAIGFQVAQLSQCINYLQTCVPTVTACANAACAQCTSLALDVVNSCCAEATSVDCFAAYLGGGSAASTTYASMENGGLSTTPAITAPPVAATTAAGAIACSSAAEYISICESLTSNFDNLPASEQATCLCYSSAAWQPQVFDGFIASCASYVPATDTSDLGALVSLEGFCSSVGNVENGASVATTTSGSILGAGGFTSSKNTMSVTSAATLAATAGSSAGSSSASPSATKTSGAEKTASKRGIAVMAGLMLLLWSF